MNRKKADRYNCQAIEEITPAHLTDLTLIAQDALGLAVDGMLGPKTRQALLRWRRSESVIERIDLRRALRDAEPLVVDDGWLRGEGVAHVPSHPSWYYPGLRTPQGTPEAVVAHYSATDHGSGRAMARHRTMHVADRPEWMRGLSSFHLATDVSEIVQLAPLTVGCWHAGGETARDIPGIGSANHTAVGIELVGHGDEFPVSQVVLYARALRAIVETYGVPRGRAMVTHQELDPERRRDPGELWMREYAPIVLDYAFGEL